MIDGVGGVFTVVCSTMGVGERCSTAAAAAIWRTGGWVGRWNGRDGGVFGSGSGLWVWFG